MFDLDLEASREQRSHDQTLILGGRLCGGGSGEERQGLSEEGAVGQAGETSSLWEVLGQRSTQDDLGFLAAGGDSQGGGEFMGNNNLGEKLGVPCIEFEKTCCFLLGELHVGASVGELRSHPCALEDLPVLCTPPAGS